MFPFVVVLVYLAFLTGSLPVKIWKITEIKSLPFLDDLFLKFAMIIEQKSLDVSLDSEKDYDNNIYYFMITPRNNGRGVIIEEWEKLEAIVSNTLL